MFESIYATDLVFVPACYKLCGDAHCCHFARYKAAAKLPGQLTQELPLLPGEYEYLEREGLLKQYADHKLARTELQLEVGTVRYDRLRLPLEGPGCACSHDFRPTICRLYPILPVFDVDDGFVGVDHHLGLYEELEREVGISRACEIQSVSFGELANFHRIARLIQSDPTCVFHMIAYQRLKDHMRERLRAQITIRPLRAREEVFQRTAALLLRGKLVELDALRTDLEQLGQQFQKRYGSGFRLSC